MLLRPHRRFQRALSAVVLVLSGLGLVACGVDNSFDPVPPAGRREIHGRLTIHTQLEADNLVGIRKIVGDLSISGSDITHLTGLQDLREITGELSLINCRNIEHLESLSELTVLGELGLALCHRLASLEPLNATRGVTRLTVIRCDSLTTLPSGPCLERIENCELTDLPALASLAPLTQMTSVTRLRLEGLPAGLDLLPLGQIDSVTEIILRDLEISALPDLTANSSLQEIELNDLPQLTSFAGLALPHVRRVRISNCPLPPSLAGLGPCPELTDLALDHCDGLTSLGIAGETSGTAMLLIGGCDGLRDLSGLAATWHGLAVFHCDSLTSLGGGAAPSSLTYLNLQSLPRLESLAGLPADLALRTFIAGPCPQLASVAGLAIVQDGSLNLHDLPSLTDLAGLEVPTSMHRLDISATGLTDLVELAPLYLVNWISIQRSPLSSLTGLEGLRTVVSGCGIHGNELLADAGALAGVVSVGDFGVGITGNPLLDTCAVEEMVAGWDVVGTVEITDNGPCAD